MEHKKNLKEKKKKLFKYLAYFLGLILVFLLWEVIALSTNELFLPEFGKTVVKMFTLFSKESTYLAILNSLLRLIIAFVIGGLLGIILGIIAGYYDFIAKVLQPLISVLKAFPTIALILLLISYVPYSQLYVVGLVIFPLVYQSTLEGSSYYYSIYENDIMLNGKNRIRNITHIIFPLSIDYILLGLIQALGLGLKVEIMSEVFAYRANFYGLGKNIYLSYQNVDYETMMANVLISLIIAIIFDFIALAIKGGLEKKIGISKDKRL